MRNRWVLLFLVGLALLAGCAFPEDKADDSTGRKIDFWHCSMHPDYQQPGPGKCGICKMDLVPVYQDAGEQLGGKEAGQIHRIGHHHPHIVGITHQWCNTFRGD